MRPARPGRGRALVLVIRAGRSWIDRAIVAVLLLGALMVAAQLLRAWLAGRL